MKILPRIVVAVAFMLLALAPLSPIDLAPAFAQGAKQAPKKDPVASPELKKEFADFIAKFRAALKANDPAAVAAMTQLPFMKSDTVRDAAQFRDKIYKSEFTAKTRACLQKGKGVYSRDQLGNDSFFIFCGEDIFVFTKTPTGFLLTEIGHND